MRSRRTATTLNFLVGINFNARNVFQRPPYRARRFLASYGVTNKFAALTRVRN